MDYEDEAPRVKRFKYQSHKESLKDVHLPSALAQTKFDQDVADNDSHFHESLDHWRQLNLSPAFIRFAGQADSLSASMPLLLHNWRELVELWTAALDVADDEAMRALMDLLQKMAHDLRTTLSPAYPDLLSRLLKLLPRAISAPALTALLETLSSLFKYLLIPSIHLDLLEQSWTAIRDTLPKCNPEVQRAVAEVWGTTLRRLKTNARERSIELMVETLEGTEDACAWVFIFACQSVSQTLHTATTSVVGPLITYHLARDASDVSYTLIRRVLTALIHHCKWGDQFAPLAEVLVAQYNAATTSTVSDAERERLRRMLEILSVPLSVREGSRISQKHIATLVASFPSLPLTPALSAAQLKFATSALTAGDMSVWMGPGRKLLEYSWTVPIFGVRLHGALWELHWGGWKMIALPGVLKSTPVILEKGPRLGAGFLAALCTSGKLGEVDLVWKKTVDRWLHDKLQNWERTEESVAELHDLLALMEFSSSASKLLICIIETTLETPDPRSEYEATFANSAWVLGSCMQALSTRPPAEWVDGIDIADVVTKTAAGWGWSEHALGGLVNLLQASSASEPLIALQTLYPYLQDGLLSHSRPLRLNVLRLLSSNLVHSTVGEKEVLKRCLQGEQVSLDVQGVRERVLRIGRVGQVVKDGDDTGADICCRWLIAQLKVNLRPLWSPAAEALSSLSQRFGDVVWRLVFDEVKTATQPQIALNALPWMHDETNEESDLHDTWEEERTWRDPSAHKIRDVVVKWLRDDNSRLEVIRSQISRERLDSMTYEAQLLATLGECSSLAEKHNRDLVPYFLSLAGPEAQSKIARQKLSAWLVLLSKFSNPKALYATETLHSLYVSQLSHPDRTLQSHSLSCLLTYKSPHLLPHANRLRLFLDDTRWRDELVSLDISQIDPQQRAEFVDVIIRLLFGLMLEKKGRTRGADRRAAVLSALGGCTDKELGLLADLMLRPMHSDSSYRPEGKFVLRRIPETVSEKQQVGFLTLLGDVVKNLGPRLLAYWPALLSTTLDLVGDAQTRIESSKVDDEDNADADVEDDDQADDTGPSSKITRSIRSLGLKRLAEFFRNPAPFDFLPYMEASFHSFISPRLQSLDKENTQAPSALLELFHVWTLQREHVHFLVDFDSRTLPQIYQCLVATNVKPAVISRIYDIVDRILAFSSVDDAISQNVVKPHISLLLTNLATLVERSKGLAAVSTPLAQRQIGILSEIAPYLTNADQASTLLGLFSPLLRKPSKFVAEKVKVDLLKILCNLFHLIPDLADRTSLVYTKTYEMLSQLLQTLRGRPAHLALISAWNQFASIDVSCRNLAALLESLNAYSKKRMDEPDFDQRLEAFRELNEASYTTLTSRDWLPVLYNMLNFIQDPEELAIRNNASYTLRHFLDLVAGPLAANFEPTFARVLWPGLKNGLRSKHEMVRVEILGVIAYAVTKCDNINSLKDMRVLLADGDDEANFFNNIHHIQSHRRARALRRLADQCDEGHLRSSTLAEVLVPLVANYVTAAASLDHHLVNEAITTTGRMAKHLTWGAYYALVQKYLKLSRDRDESERVYVRTLVSILENFHFPMEEIVLHPAEVEDLGLEDGEDWDHDDSTQQVPKLAPAKTVDVRRIADAVNIRLLPNLLNHLEKRDITEDSMRIPISLGIVRVAQHLPEATREPQILRLLTILCQVLRSKSSETRDLTRDTLCRIAVTLGPSYLPIILRELRGALLRGPQLHVLAYVTHALLVHVTTGEHADAFEALDDCVNDVAHVSAEVVFGESGKDLQSEDFKTKMREVRAAPAKGLDSFTILAKFVTPSKISAVLHPLRGILKETESSKVMQQVDEVLRRISTGLNANKHLVPAELLVLCHTLISQNARFLKQAPSSQKHRGKPKGDAVVQMKRNVVSDVDHFANNSFRFVVFGLDLFHTAFRRGRFDFKDAAIIARLEPMVSVIGNTLYSTNAPVLTLGLKASASIVKCPLKSLDKSLPIFIRQVIDIVKQTGSTESELVQTAFKSLAAILRDCPSAQVKEMDLVYLLELLAPDLEDPTRQASVFTMLRAIVARRFIVPEIYDLMDKVSEIMVTSQSPHVQELCRGALLQFLLDYPQGKGRLRNQMAFLAKNLSYVYESGRKSVMEILSAIIAKFEVSLVREYADLLFVGLVMVIANDDSTKCREMAAELIKGLFSHLDEDHRQIVLSHLHSWASQQSQPQLVRVSSQVYGLIIDVLQDGTLPYITAILDDLNASIERSTRALDSAEDAAMDVDLEWQVPYHAMTTLSKALRVFPEATTHRPDKVLWPAVASHLLFPHAWVRTVSCRLIGLLYNAVPAAEPAAQLPDESPLSRVGMQEVAKKMCLQLKSEHLDGPLSLQIVKNLFYVGKSFCAIPLAPSQASVEDAVNEMEDEDDSFGEEGGSKANDPLPWLFSKLSYQARSAHIARRNRTFSSNNWSHQPLSVLRWFAAMASYMEPSRLETFLVHILSPLYRIVEDDTIRDPQMDELKTLGAELQDLVQSKVGTTKFASVYNQIRQSVLGVRRDRKAAKVMQVTTNPEAAAKRKIQRNVIKKDSRKRKSQVFAEGKGRSKRRREE